MECGRAVTWDTGVVSIATPPLLTPDAAPMLRGQDPPPGTTLNFKELAAGWGLPAPWGGAGSSPAIAVSLSVASTPPPSSVPRLQLSPKTFGVSIRTAFPRTRRGSVSPPPHVPAPPGARAPPQPPPRADPALRARSRRLEQSRGGPETGLSPALPAAPVSPGHLPRRSVPAAPAPPPRPGAPRSRPPPAQSLAVPPARRRLLLPPWPGPPGPPPPARRLPRPGGSADPELAGGRLAGLEVPLDRRLRVRTRRPRVSNLDDPPRPGQVHAKVGGGGVGGGKEGRAPF